MSMDTLVFGAIPPPPESCCLKREPETEPETKPETEPEPESKVVSGPNWDWELKPLDDLTVSDFSSFEDDIAPFVFSCPRFVYKNKAQREEEAASKRALDEYRERSRNLTVRVSLTLFRSLFVRSVINICILF